MSDNGRGWELKYLGLYAEKGVWQCGKGSASTSIDSNIGRECITEVLEARLHHTHRPFDPLRLSDVFESTVCAR